MDCSSSLSAFMTEEKKDGAAAVPGCLRGENIEPVGATLL